MKNIVLALALAIGLSVNAQVNKNVTKETTTKRTTVNDGKSVKSSEVNQTRTAQQELDFKDAESNKLNKDLKPTPVAVTTSTTVSGDGIPPQEIDRSSYYTMNGQRFQFVSDNNTGYRVISGDNQNFGKMRKTSNNNYIYRSGSTTSIGYFDKDGNFVVETYDDKTDGVTVQTYSRVKP